MQGTTLWGILMRAGRLARIAASGAGAWKGWLLYLVVLCLAFVGIWISVQMIAWNKAFYDALGAMDRAAALRQVGVFMALTALSAASYLLADWLRKRLLILWRERLTSHALDLWLNGRGYWHLRPGFSALAVENPDQRVAEDCRLYVQHLLTMTLDLVSEVAGLFSYVAVLWSVANFTLHLGAVGLDVSVPRYMFWLAPAYVIASTLITHLLGRPLKRTYFERERVEADFRHALVRLRDRADTIAQAGGETAERRALDQRFAHIARNWRQVMRAELVQGMFSRPYYQTILRMPTFFALPMYFAGAVTLGGLMQVASAFSSVTATLSWFIFNYKKLAEFVAVCERLDGLLQAACHTPPDPSVPQAIRVQTGPDVALKGIRLATPAGTWLPPCPDVTLPAGQALLVTGCSGVGKTTLLSALAGLWPFGTGHMTRPEVSPVMLPAGAPILGDCVRSAACYPQPPESLDPDRLTAVIHRVGLGHRLQGEGLVGLSMGERQRLGLARAVLNRPEWLIMDEATSALDPAAEADLLTWLRQELPHATLVVVAHRTPLGLHFNQTILLGQPTFERRSA